MLILLISPRVNFSTDITELDDFWQSMRQTAPSRNIWSGISTALLTIAALTPSRHEVRFIDENIEPVDFSVACDLVGISALTPNALRAYAIADEFRKCAIPVVLGGIHATLLPDEAKMHADSVVVGEAEYTWKRLLDDVETGSLRPFYHSEKPVSMDDSPIPRYDLLKGDRYNYIWLQTSRGCPHDCEYCVSSKVFGRGFRRKSASRIIDELQLIKKLFPGKQVFFADDNFLSNRTTITPVLEAMCGLGLRWNAQSDIDAGADPSFVTLLRRSGCVLLFIGLESLNAEGLHGLEKNGWKYRQLKNYASFISTIQSAGIGVMGGFMVGLDSDTPSTFGTIGDFIIENHLYHASITILTPAPGTRLRERFAREQRLLTLPWDKYTGYNATFVPAHMSIGDLAAGLTELYQRIYAPEVFESTMEHFKRVQKRLMQSGRV